MICPPEGKRLSLDVPKKAPVIYEVVVPGLLKQYGVDTGEVAAIAKKVLAGREA